MAQPSVLSPTSFTKRGRKQQIRKPCDHRIWHVCNLLFDSYTNCTRYCLHCCVCCVNWPNRQAYWHRLVSTRTRRRLGKQPHIAHSPILHHPHPTRLDLPYDWQRPPQTKKAIRQLKFRWSWSWVHRKGFEKSMVVLFGYPFLIKEKSGFGSSQSELQALWCAQKLKAHFPIVERPEIGWQISSLVNFSPSLNKKLPSLFLPSAIKYDIQKQTKFGPSDNYHLIYRQYSNTMTNSKTFFYFFYTYFSQRRD